jgi:ribose transport system permease protein
MPSTTRARLGYFVNLLGPFLGLIFVIAIFSLQPEVRRGFLTGGNLKIIFTQTVIVASCALGMTMIIVSGGIDLSVGSIVALTSVVGAKLLELQSRTPPVVISAWLVAVIMIGVAAFIGFLNGALIAGFRLLPFIVTLGMMGIARGTAKWLADNQAVNYDEKSSLNNLMALEEPYSFLPLPPGVWMVIAMAIVTGLVMKHTVFGRYVFAIGSNEATARLCGIRVPFTKVIIYTLSGVFVGVAGLLQMSRLAVGDPTVAVGLELDVIAAVVIGGASLNGGVGTIFGSMIGALIMAVLRNGSNQMGWSTSAQEIIIGIVIVLAVGIDKLRQKKVS